MRLIDADALIKVMTDGIAPSTKDGGFEHPFDILRAIDNAPTIELNQWVSVKDKPPEENVDVQIYIPEHYPQKYDVAHIEKIKHPAYEGDFYWSGKVAYGSKYVTHWQPLSEPYKGE